MKNKLILEYLKEKEIEPEGIYKIHPYTFLESFLKFIEQKRTKSEKPSMS